MTDSELQEIKTAINAAKQYSEDKPNGRYERLLIACIEIMEYAVSVYERLLRASTPKEYNFWHYALSIARAINHR